MRFLVNFMSKFSPHVENVLLIACTYMCITILSPSMCVCASARACVNTRLPSKCTHKRLSKFVARWNKSVTSCDKCLHSAHAQVRDNVLQAHGTDLAASTNYTERAYKWAQVPVLCMRCMSVYVRAPCQIKRDGQEGSAREMQEERGIVEIGEEEREWNTSSRREGKRNQREREGRNGRYRYRYRYGYLIFNAHSPCTKNGRRR